jgi:hypothetical protein
MKYATFCGIFFMKDPRLCGYTLLHPVHLLLHHFSLTFQPILAPNQFSGAKRGACGGGGGGEDKFKIFTNIAFLS